MSRPAGASASQPCSSGAGSRGRGRGAEPGRGRGTRQVGAWRNDGARGWGLPCGSPGEESVHELCGVGEGGRVHDL